MKPHKQARKAFDAYAALDAPQLPHAEFNLPALQVLLCRWQARNFDSCSVEHQALGAAEEVGELCHAILKHAQGIRGMDDEDAFRAAAGDAIADCAIFLMQIATGLRLDFGTLLEATAREVLAREWRATK